MEEKLKIFVQDNGWRGSILVISSSEENARKQMAGEANYFAEDPVIEHEIKEGFIFANYGDM